jgi:hypothetical protein
VSSESGRRWDEKAERAPGRRERAGPSRERGERDGAGPGLGAGPDAWTKALRRMGFPGGRQAVDFGALGGHRRGSRGSAAQRERGKKLQRCCEFPLRELERSSTYFPPTSLSFSEPATFPYRRRQAAPLVAQPERWVGGDTRQLFCPLLPFGRQQPRDDAGGGWCLLFKRTLCSAMCSNHISMVVLSNKKLPLYATWRLGRCVTPVCGACVVVL